MRGEYEYSPPPSYSAALVFHEFGDDGEVELVFAGRVVCEWLRPEIDIIDTSEIGADPYRALNVFVKSSDRFGCKG